MNILVIRNSYTVGGAELYYVKLQKAFKKFGFDHNIILITNNLDLKKRAERSGILTYHVDVFGEEVGTKKGILRLLFHLPRYIHCYSNIINKCINEFSIYTVLLSGKTEKYIITPLLWFKNIRIFWIEHGRVFTQTMSRIALLLYRISSLFCTCILSESIDTKEDLIKNKINQKIIKYIGSGIDIDHYFFSKKKHINKFIVGFMATLDWEKGVEELINTIKKINNKNSKVQFYILGDGPQLNYLKQKITQLGLEKKVHFFGRISEVRRVLFKISILLSPIKHPGGISLSVLEAMSMGCVPIVTDIGGNRELIQNNITGYICSSNYSKFASYTVLKLYKDRKLLDRISHTAREYVVKKYSDKIFVNRFVDSIS